MSAESRAAWERERAAAERLARAEVARLEGLLARLNPRSQAGQVTRVAAQLGTARHAVRGTLRLSEWAATMRTQQPARFRRLVEELGPP